MLDEDMVVVDLVKVSSSFLSIALDFGGDKKDDKIDGFSLEVIKT